MSIDSIPIYELTPAVGVCKIEVRIVSKWGFSAIDLFLIDSKDIYVYLYKFINVYVSTSIFLLFLYANENGVDEDAHLKVRKNLRFFNKQYLLMVQAKESIPDLKGITKVMNANAVLYPRKRIGDLPGLDVGHRFFSRAEMVAIGFHSHWLNISSNSCRVCRKFLARQPLSNNKSKRQEVKQTKRVTIERDHRASTPHEKTFFMAFTI